jgi:HEAT repeat protein
LVALLGHSEARVRKTAVTALGKMEATEALASVQKLKSDPAASVRTAAATAESSLNAAAIRVASYSAPRPPDARDYAMDNARTNARKRLGMP